MIRLTKLGIEIHMVDHVESVNKHPVSASNMIKLGHLAVEYDSFHLFCVYMLPNVLHL